MKANGRQAVKCPNCGNRSSVCPDCGHTAALGTLAHCPTDGAPMQCEGCCFVVAAGGVLKAANDFT